MLTNGLNLLPRTIRPFNMIIYLFAPCKSYIESYPPSINARKEQTTTLSNTGHGGINQRINQVGMPV